MSIQNLGAAQHLRVRDGGVREGNGPASGIPVSSGAGTCPSPCSGGQGTPRGEVWVSGVPGRRAGLPGRLPGVVLGQSLIACPRAEQGQSPGVCRARPTSSHTAQPSAPSPAPTGTPVLAPPARCVYSGRTRNRTRPQSQPPSSGVTCLHCLPGDWPWRETALRRGCAGSCSSPGPVAPASLPWPGAAGRGAVASLWPHLPAGRGGG